MSIWFNKFYNFLFFFKDKPTTSHNHLKRYGSIAQLSSVPKTGPYLCTGYAIKPGCLHGNSRFALQFHWLLDKFKIQMVIWLWNSPKLEKLYEIRPEWVYIYNLEWVYSLIACRYDVYLVREPCHLCSMALIHMRSRRVFYSQPSRQVVTKHCLLFFRCEVTSSGYLVRPVGT